MINFKIYTHNLWRSLTDKATIDKGKPQAPQETTPPTTLGDNFVKDNEMNHELQNELRNGENRLAPRPRVSPSLNWIKFKRRKLKSKSFWGKTLFRNFTFFKKRLKMP